MATRRGRYIHVDVELEIRRLVDKELSPSQIFQKLDSQPEFRDKVPSLRTIERRVSELRPRDPSDRWDWQQEVVEDTRAVLDVLQAVIERTEGRKYALTNREAQFVERVLKAAPGLNPWAVYLVARYILTTEINVRVRARRAPNEGDMAEVDAFLAYQPWKSERHLERYKRAVDNEWILGLPDQDYIIGMHQMLSKEEHS